MAQSCTREFRLEMQKHLFTKRVVKCWNKLPREAINAPCLSVLNRYLDSALNNTILTFLQP